MTTTGRHLSAPVAVDRPRKKIAPTNWWAIVGGTYLLFVTFVTVRWIAGPNFEAVPPGPTEVPTYMKVSITFFQVVSIPVAIILIYLTVVRPWLRERRVGPDGLIILAAGTLWFQDPLSSYGGHWFTYNAYAFNRGSWTSSVPGWLSFNEPGAMLVEPFLVVCGAYVYIFAISTTLGTLCLRRLSARFPHWGAIRLMSVTFIAMFLFDVLFEGIIMMPLGLWEYPGGHFKIFGDHYFAFPLHEAVVVGLAFTLIASLRFFTDDRGRMLSERGIDGIRWGEGGRLVVRSLATIGVVNVIFFACYNVPHFWVGLHSAEWNEDFVKRSYFTNGLCGDGTDRACPGPGVPNIRDGGAYITPEGEAIIPEGAEIPRQVPFIP